MSTTTKRQARRPAHAKQRMIPVSFKTTKFAAIETKPEVFGEDWDHKRGFIARATAVILQYDDKELERRFLGDATKAHALMDLQDAIRAEIDYLKHHIKILDAATLRILAVAHRFKDMNAEYPKELQP
jgi:hypothetical protein